MFLFTNEWQHNNKKVAKVIWRRPHRTHPCHRGGSRPPSNTVFLGESLPQAGPLFVQPFLHSEVAGIHMTDKHAYEEFKGG